MTNEAMSERDKAWKDCIKNNPTRWEFHQWDFNKGFDAGIEAERERVIKEIKNSLSEFPLVNVLLLKLFPDQQEQRSEC